MKAHRMLLAGLVATGFLAAPRARAFCQARACESPDSVETCEFDDHGCASNTAVLRWASSCVTFDVQRDGSPASGLDAERVAEVSGRAFAAWMNADCGGEPPSITIGTFGPVACDESRFNRQGKNANIVMFRDESWPYAESIDSYGITFVRFDTETGEIWDADVEINSADFDLGTDGDGQGTDLQSILTHEFGHFLGLTHPGLDEGATMSGRWNGEGTDLRTLAQDDVEGICATYPPGRDAPTSCEPRHGFSGQCFVPIAAPAESGCALSRGPTSDAGFGLIVALVPLISWRRRTRSPRARA